MEEVCSSDVASEAVSEGVSSDEVSLDDVQYKLYNTLDDNDIKMSVSEAVMSLSSELREVILLRFYRDLPIKDISKILSLPESTINYRLLRAKSLLKDTLKEDFFDESKTC